MTTHYVPTEGGGVRFCGQRRPGDVRIPNYVYDIWMPLLGSDAMGVYAVYCRLERQDVVKAMSLARIAKECRIGVRKLEHINAMLTECGFIQVKKPAKHERLMHWTTEITVLDPPKEASAELIQKYEIESGYEVLCPWLEGEEDNQMSNDFSGDVKQHAEEMSSDSPKVAALGLQSLEVAAAPEDFSDIEWNDGGDELLETTAIERFVQTGDAVLDIVAASDLHKRRKIPDWAVAGPEGTKPFYGSLLAFCTLTRRAPPVTEDQGTEWLTELAEIARFLGLTERQLTYAIEQMGNHKGADWFLENAVWAAPHSKSFKDRLDKVVGELRTGKVAVVDGWSKALV